jgi:DNA polymerase-3 subunit beta
MMATSKENETLNAINPNPTAASTALQESLSMSLAEVLARLNIPIPHDDATPDEIVVAEPAATDDSNVVTVDFQAARDVAETIEPSPDLPDAAPDAEPEPEAAVTLPVAPMFLMVDGAGFARAVIAAESVIEQRTEIPILSNVRLTAAGGMLAIEGTDLDLAVRVTVACDGADLDATVPGHTLVSLAKQRKDGALSISVDGGTATFTAGRSELKLNTLPVADYPELLIDEAEWQASFTIGADKLCAALEAISFAISTEETRYYLNGVYLHTYSRLGKTIARVVATDGHRLAYFDLPDLDIAGTIGSNAIIPRKAVATALSLLGKMPKAKKGEAPLPPATVMVQLSEKRVRLTCGDIRITSKLIDGTYPDYNRVVPNGNDKRLAVDIDALTAAIEAVTIISSERGRAVRMSLADNRLILSVNNPDMGTASETIDCEYQADAMDIGFNSRYLMDILSRISPPGKRKAAHGTATFLLADPGAPTLIQSDYGPVCVLMPIRI